MKIGRCRLLFLLWPVGQAVKTAASHAVNVGSSPARVIKNHLSLGSGDFFVSVRGIEQGGAPQRTKNSPVDCFLARGRFPRVSPETLQLMLECFFVYPVRGIEPDGAQVLLCAIMERCVFGCILDMKIPPELSEFFLCLL